MTTTTFTYTSQKSIRDAFWDQNPQFKRVSGWKQNQYNATIRSAFVDFVNQLQRNSDISDALADRTTL